MSEFRHAAYIADGEGTPHTKRQIDQHEINTARQAAEALFAPKRPTTEPAGPVSMALGDQVPRKPRILRALAVQPTRVEEKRLSARRESRRPAQQMPSRHLARIQIWLRYGMTVRQAAKVYGVSVSEIQRVLQQA